jgi:hypothetical protein
VRAIDAWRRGHTSCVASGVLDQREKHVSAAATTLTYFSPRSTAFDQSEKRISAGSTALAYFSQ